MIARDLWWMGSKFKSNGFFVNISNIIRRNNLMLYKNFSTNVLIIANCLYEIRQKVQHHDVIIISWLNDQNHSCSQWRWIHKLYKQNPFHLSPLRLWCFFLISFMLRKFMIPFIANNVKPQHIFGKKIADKDHFHYKRNAKIKINFIFHYGKNFSNHG